jgi:hypothetical protein
MNNTVDQVRGLVARYMVRSIHLSSSRRKCYEPWASFCVSKEYQQLGSTLQLLQTTCGNSCWMRSQRRRASKKQSTGLQRLTPRPSPTSRTKWTGSGSCCGARTLLRSAKSRGESATVRAALWAGGDVQVCDVGSRVLGDRRHRCDWESRMYWPLGAVLWKPDMPPCSFCRCQFGR